MLIFSLYAGGVNAASIDLFQWGVNIDGSVALTDPFPPTLPDPIPTNVDISLFDESTGLGTITLEVMASGVRARTVDFFFDHEFDEPINSFFNEYGSVSAGTLNVGQSWEIDEPGFLFGDIFNNFLASTLDNSNNVPDIFPDDVSVAMGWDFELDVGEMAMITMLIADNNSAVLDDFYLTHTDPDSNAFIFFSSSLEIKSIVAPIPAPATLLLVLIGFLGIVRHKRLIVT